MNPPRSGLASGGSCRATEAVAPTLTASLQRTAAMTGNTGRAVADRSWLERWPTTQSSAEHDWMEAVEVVAVCLSVEGVRQMVSAATVPKPTTGELVRGRKRSFERLGGRETEGRKPGTGVLEESRWSGLQGRKKEPGWPRALSVVLVLRHRP
jgi:hypothetical protein